MDDSSPRPWLGAVLREAGDEAMRRFRAVDARAKADGSPVTEADRAAEAVLVEAILRDFPGDAIVGEEGARVAGRADGGTWYLDPIDGTSSFVHGLAGWGPTVCRVHDGRIELGGFWLPRLGELYWGVAGGGAFRDADRLSPPPDPPLGRGDILFAPSRFHRRGPVPWPGKVRALGSSAAHLALVAAGSGVAAVIPRWALWDVGCGVLLIQEVGRVIWDAEGREVDVLAEPPGLPIVAGAPTALQQLLQGGWTARALAGTAPHTDGTAE